MIHSAITAVKKFFLLFVGSYFLHAQIIAQSGNATFRNITSADGLPSTSITDFAQDAFGFIWIGSWDGDYRYDGHIFKKISSSTDGRYLKADKKGGIWIRFEYSVGYYDPFTDSVKKYDIPNADRFPDIAIDNAGTVWVATTDGILKFDPTKNIFIKDAGQQPGGIRDLTANGNGELLFLYRQKKDIPILLGQRNSKGTYSYEFFPADENNPEKGKSFISLTDSKTANLDNRPAFIRRIDSTGILIINSFGWAYKSKKEANWVFKKSLTKKFSLTASDAKLDYNGNLWLIQENAINKINITTGETTVYTNDPANPNSLLPLNQTLAGCNIFFDRQGVLWIASFSHGISRLNLFESDFGLLKDSTGAPIQDVLSALELKDGSYWIGARMIKNGLVHYSAGGKIIKKYGARAFDASPGKTISTDLSHPFAWSLAETADGSIWAGGGSPGPNRGGLSRIRPGTNEITRFKNDPNDTASLTGNWIYSIQVDGSGRVWAVSTKGVSLIDPVTEKVTRGANIRSWIEKDNSDYFPPLINSSGDLLIGNQTNFNHYLVDHKTLSVKPFAANVTAPDSLFFVHQDDAGKFWFVSPKGFGFLDSSLTRIAHFYEYKKLGLPVNEETGILNSDKQGNIWLGTDNGIFEFDPATEKFKHFGFERGLQGNHFNHLNYKGPSGKIYFGGNGGVNIFDPAAIKTNPYPPEMIFTGLKLDGKSITFGEKSAIQKPIFAADKIIVAPGVLTISIDFAAIHFAGNNNNQYQYKLEGFDKDWREGGTIGNATYTNLSPGNYTFYIKGSNWDGVWSDGKKSIEIKILPPWWRTWWAYTFYASIALFLLWRLDKYQKTRTIRKEREKTQQRELEQAKEIEKAYHELKSTQQQLIQSEKMASLGELTAGIAHEIQNPLNFVNNFSEVSNELITEMNMEIEKGDIEEAKAIANDIRQNLEKIHYHGKRADAIVKGMLQHSRNSSGVKEPTDINALADEYLRLAYHGLRAKDKSFNATIKTGFDNTIGNINIIPQDIGRVILNLITNAFYVVDEKKKQQPENYEPTVSVSTKKINDKVEIRVADNGNGIPEKVLNKIFQPFFTTKPTGQGTGLGLSLSYDIVKAHGGELKVETKEGEGAEFIIQLSLR
ncbi:MAG: ATP-binding protein [Sphingobacteriales bacterium]